MDAVLDCFHPFNSTDVPHSANNRERENGAGRGRRGEGGTNRKLNGALFWRCVCVGVLMQWGGGQVFITRC